MPDFVDMTAGAVMGGAAKTEEVDPIAAAERELIEAGLARYLGAELGVAEKEFFARCDRFNQYSLPVALAPPSRPGDVT
jgi:hypothetical protein